MRNKLALFLSALALTLAISPNIVNAASTDIYTVKPGDSLWIIANKYQIGLSEIIQSNPQFKNPHLIYPGNKVTVPLIDDIKSVEEQVVALVNGERAKVGAPPLTLNWQVARVARYKSEDMHNKNYFDHQSPTYGSPFDMMKSFNIKYSSGGENIAKGQKDAYAVMQAWMKSPGHKANILSKNFTEIGVGYYKASGGTTYWTQMFIRP